MNKAMHIIGGSLTSLGLYIADNKTRGNENKPAQAVLSIIIGGFGGYLPDLLDKPTSYTHRRFWHSKTLAVLLAYLFSKANTNNKNVSFIKLTLKEFIVAYESHLILDSQTKMGLPLI